MSDESWLMFAVVFGVVAWLGCALALVLVRNDGTPRWPKKEGKCNETKN
jgi:hypothetical protein